MRTEPVRALVITEKLYKEKPDVAQRLMYAFVEATDYFIKNPQAAEKYVREDMFKNQITSQDFTDAIGNSGYGRWSRRGRGGGGGGGRGYFNPRSFVPNFGGDAVRIFMPRGIEPARQDDLYSINTSNPIIRRATLRRERFSSERGRLNQWQ